MTDHTLQPPERESEDDVVFLLEGASGLEQWNDRLTGVVERDEDTFADADPVSLFDPADREAVRRAIGEALGRGEAAVEASFDGFGDWVYDVRFVRDRDASGVRMTAVASETTAGTDAHAAAAD